MVVVVGGGGFRAGRVGWGGAGQLGPGGWAGVVGLVRRQYEHRDFLRNAVNVSERAVCGPTVGEKIGRSGGKAPFMEKVKNAGGIKCIIQ